MDALRLNILEKSLMDKVQHGDHGDGSHGSQLAMTGSQIAPKKRWKTIGKP